MYFDYDKNENFYHAALIFLRKLSIGSQKSNIKLKELLNRYGSFENIYKKNVWFKKSEQLNSLESIIKRLEKVNFSFKTITTCDNKFPEQLNKISGATPILYTRGDITLAYTKTIAVVGTRKPLSKEEIREAKKVIYRILEKDYTIVSGLAEGCDMLAHVCAINNKKPTIAVIGTPLDIYYPAKHRSVQKRIAKDYLLVSQYPIGIKTFPSYFAHRNITTVGLATEGVVVIKSDDKSGTLHAIKHCIKQNKPLYILRENLKHDYEWVKKYKDYIKVPN